MIEHVRDELAALDDALQDCGDPKATGATADRSLGERTETVLRTSYARTAL